MRLAHLLTVATATAAAVVATAPPAAAHWDVMLGTNGSCPAGYGEWVQVDQTTLCIHGFIPDATVVTTGAPCPTGYTEVSVINFYRICLLLGH